MVGEVCLQFASDCRPTWEGISAVATALAVGIALFLAVREAQSARLERRSLVREVCSVADRLVAYHGAATALLETNPIYVPQFQSLELISENCITLQKIAKTLIDRPSLSDGAISLAANSERIAECIIDAGSNAQAMSQNGYERRKQTLVTVSLIVDQTAKRIASVRKYYGLPASTAAARIHTKYDAICAICKNARENNLAPVVQDVFSTPD